MTGVEVGTLLAASAVVLLPGVSVLAMLGVRRALWLAGLSPVVSVGVATVVGMVCGLLGLSFGVVPLGVATALAAAVGVLRWARARRSAAPARRRRTARSAVSSAAGLLVLLVGVAYAVRTWMLGMAGDLSKVPQEHDTIVHSELVAYIMNTGRGAPWQLLPIDFLSNGPVHFYPSGMHLLSAAVGELTGDPIRGLNGVTVLLLGVCAALSTAALAFVAARRARLGAPAALLAAGFGALVAVGLNAPTITLTAQGGVLPNAAALVLTPGFAAVLLSVRRRDWSGAVAVAIGFTGLVALHPSAVMSVGVTVVAWWLGELMSRGGLARLRGQLAPLAVAGGLAALVAAPLLVQLVGQSGKTSGFPADVPAAPLATALGQTLSLPLTGYLPQYEGRAQVAAFLLAVVGALVLLTTRRALGLLTATAAWVAITVGMWISPGSGFESAITAFFYNAMLRIRSHVYLLVPVLVGVGVVLACCLVAARLRRTRPLRGRATPALALATAFALVVAAGYALAPARGYLEVNAHYLGTRYGDPDLLRVDRDDFAAFDFLAGRVGPGERVMNSANDGSTYLYVEKGIPVVNTIAMGFERAPYTYQLLQRFNRYPTDDGIRELVLDLDITWVYVDGAPPPIGAAGSPENWAGNGLFTFAPGLADLAGLPGLTEEFRSGEVRVYRLDRAVVEQLG